MIVEYNRPASLEEALHLLARTDPLTKPLAGGSALTKPSRERFAVVDLQALGLDTLIQRGNFLDLGATYTLQNLLESEPALPGLKPVIRLEAPYNLRQVASVVGTLVSADGRSPFTSALLALDATLVLQPADEQMSLGDLLPFRAGLLQGRLVTQVTIPLNAGLAYHYVARTPADLPIVCAALAAWPSGRVRLALGGYGNAPVMAFDGNDDGGLEAAARNAYSDAGDEWASAEYRQETAGVLALRALDEARRGIVEIG